MSVTNLGAGERKIMFIGRHVTEIHSLQEYEWQDPVPLPLGGKNSPMKLALHLLLVAYHPMCSDSRRVQWMVGKLEVLTEHWWSSYPGNTLTLWSQPPVTGLCFLDAAWGILFEKRNINLKLCFWTGNAVWKVRKMINILTKYTQT